MVEKMRLAVAGIGNNIAALQQGIQYYQRFRADMDAELVGIKHPFIGPLHVSDIDIVAGFDVDLDKIGKPLHVAIFSGTNNYPNIVEELRPSTCTVKQGAVNADSDIAPIVQALRESRAEVLLYSLPTGLQWAAELYARAALEAGVGFVNCTPEIVARNPEILAAYEKANVPMMGDDLASHLGTSVVHRVLLGLLNDRGITLNSSYQLNLGGNADFKNLRVAGASKQQSKLNALAQDGVDTSRVEVIPSAGFVSQLCDNKVAYLNIEGAGWGGTPVSVDLKLKVQDSSNAAGVIIDLIRVACVAGRQQRGGFHPAAVMCLKSPPGGHPSFSEEQVAQSFARLNVDDAHAASYV
jgi:myo-inositol-1-phosphate synthase